MHGSTLSKIAPDLVSNLLTRMINTRLTSEGLNQHDWTNDIPESLSMEELTQSIHLWELLMQFVITPGSGDKAVWSWHKSGIYSAASAYRMFCAGGIRFAPTAAIWKNGAPLACKIFMWLALG